MPPRASEVSRLASLARALDLAPSLGFRETFFFLAAQSRILGCVRSRHASRRDIGRHLAFGSATWSVSGPEGWEECRSPD